MSFPMLTPKHYKISDIGMKNNDNDDDNCRENWVFEKLLNLMRRCVYHVLSIGPIPKHVAFIMDGNRRYARRNKIVKGLGHKSGFIALISMLKYCYELDVKYVTIYAFSIDNFKRYPEETSFLMDLMQEKIKGLIVNYDDDDETNIVNKFGMRVHFVGDLKLLNENLRVAAKRVMAETSKNSGLVLSICIAYSSTNEILHSVKESCEEKLDEIRVLDESGAGYGLIGIRRDVKNGYYYSLKECLIKLEDIERNLYMEFAPCPDMLIRTFGENRLSNFLLWQSTFCYLYSPSVLWLEIGFWHLVWAILNYQRNYFYLDKKKKQS